MGTVDAQSHTGRSTALTLQCHLLPLFLVLLQVLSPGPRVVVNNESLILYRLQRLPVGSCRTKSLPRAVAATDASPGLCSSTSSCCSFFVLPWVLWGYGNREAPSQGSTSPSSVQRASFAAWMKDQLLHLMLCFISLPLGFALLSRPVLDEVETCLCKYSFSSLCSNLGGKNVSFCETK